MRHGRCGVVISLAGRPGTGWRALLPCEINYSRVFLGFLWDDLSLGVIFLKSLCRCRSLLVWSRPGQVYQSSMSDASMSSLNAVVALAALICSLGAEHNQ